MAVHGPVGHHLGVLRKMVSGGQSGADRGALDAALDAEFPCGGVCPRGRRAEDGAIADRYPLDEHPSPDYPDRTRANIERSDGTVILARGALTGGTALTRDLAVQLGRPLLVIDLATESEPVAAAAISSFVRECGIEVLNVAGPRESGCPGIAAAVRRVMTQVIADARSTTG